MCCLLEEFGKGAAALQDKKFHCPVLKGFGHSRHGNLHIKYKHALDISGFQGPPENCELFVEKQTQHPQKLNFPKEIVSTFKAKHNKKITQYNYLCRVKKCPVQGEAVLEADANTASVE